MWDIVIVGAACLSGGIVAGMLINVGRPPAAPGQAEKVAKLELDREICLNRIERMRGDNFALAAQNEELVKRCDDLAELADMGRRVRDARDKQNLKKKAARATAKA